MKKNTITHRDLPWAITHLTAQSHVRVQIKIRRGPNVHRHPSRHQPSGRPTRPPGGGVAAVLRRARLQAPVCQSPGAQCTVPGTRKRGEWGRNGRSLAGPVPERWGVTAKERLRNVMLVSRVDVIRMAPGTRWTRATPLERWPEYFLVSLVWGCCAALC